MNNKNYLIFVIVIIVIIGAGMLYFAKDNDQEIASDSQDLAEDQMLNDNGNNGVVQREFVNRYENNNPFQGESVLIRGLRFYPETLTIERGTTVTWTNNHPMPHSVDSEILNSGLLSRGESYSYTFNDEGVFDYFCAMHPVMTGTIIVE